MKRLSVLTTGLLFLASCSNSPKMESSSTDSSNKMMTATENKAEDKKQRNIQAAKEMLQGVNDHNADAVLKYASPEFVDYGDGSMGAVKNVDSVKKMIDMFFKAMPDYKGENFTYIADGNKVAVEGEWSGTFKNDMMGMKATGKSFKVKDVDILTFNDEGKVTEHRSIYPVAYMLTGAGETTKK